MVKADLMPFYVRFRRTFGRYGGTENAVGDRPLRRVNRKSLGPGVELPMDFPQPIPGYMRVYFRGADIRVAEQLLNNP
jgi:hypothetical protein